MFSLFFTLLLFLSLFVEILQPPLNMLLCLWWALPLFKIHTKNITHNTKLWCQVLAIIILFSWDIFIYFISLNIKPKRLRYKMSMCRNQLRIPSSSFSFSDSILNRFLWLTKFDNILICVSLIFWLSLNILANN